jgi:anhydro-N-acetylmuramic acid kinase
VSPTAGLFAGLMSGTSLDGVDGVLVHLAEDRRPRCLAHVHHPFDDALRHELLALNAPGADELHRAALAGNAIARDYADVVHDLLETAGIAAQEVRAIGAHGQTVRHRPGEFDGTGYTTQLLNGALLAELTGIDVVCDLRSRDLAAGGQGAPLVPAFHRALFSADQEAIAVLNIGGIANLTLLPPTRAGASGLIGFDCGPGNALMDGWCEAHTGHRFDEGGRWAASGRVHLALLRRLLSESYFDRPPPKSTGRDLFHRTWLDQAMADVGADVDPAVVQATLAELTALSAADALQRHAPATQRLLVCGGGAHNSHLMRRLAAHLPGLTVSSTDTVGVPPEQVEALAFAWLAQALIERRAGNLPSVTGARGARILGALHPAG